MTNIRLVTKQEQVLQNIRNFQKEVETNGRNNYLVDKMSHFRAFYAIKVDGKILLAPSKYIGYRDRDLDTSLTANMYAVNIYNLDGRKTEDALKPWFVEVSSGPLYDELSIALDDLMASFGKKPNALVRFSVCKHDHPSAGEETGGGVTNLVEALLTIYREMPGDVQQEFRRRIKKEA